MLWKLLLLLSMILQTTTTPIWNNISKNLWVKPSMHIMLLPTTIITKNEKTYLATRHPNPYCPKGTRGKQKKFKEDILPIVMAHIMFQLDDTYWLQTCGTSMGTNHAGAYATVYWAYIECKFIIPKWEQYIPLLCRFIDNKFWSLDGNRRQNQKTLPMIWIHTVNYNGKLMAYNPQLTFWI